MKNLLILLLDNPVIFGTLGSAVTFLGLVAEGNHPKVTLIVGIVMCGLVVRLAIEACNLFADRLYVR